VLQVAGERLDLMALARIVERPRIADAGATG